MGQLDELKQKTVWNLILNPLYVPSFYSNCGFLCFLFLSFLVFSSYLPLKLVKCNWWIKSNLILNPILVVWIVLFFFLRSLFFPFLVIKVFYFSDNLSDDLLLKKGFRTRDRLFWSQWEEALDKKVNRFSALGHQVVLRLGEPNALLHNYDNLFVGAMRSQLQVLKLLSSDVYRFLTPWLNQDKGKVSLFYFHKTSDLTTVQNHWS